ncbi:hypothetical protein GA0070616_4365 [Micromonospora nigra]|uniref:DUF3168 domain-containing protein n=1 Tax=Micromonospora nigra TaxID=145857 RepID=A0A1C6SRL5_9ACTN|nr:hypothetical protein [Micromonospora nigra]SCL31963.1 hypothetical protein GA0070616_4365 [Micromonospora nigra]
MGSSIPAALDYLAREIPLLEPVREASVAVSDGWPTQRSDRMIAIGVLPEDEDTSVVVSYAELSRQEYEDVEVPCIVVVRCGGSTATADARRGAYALIDAIQELVRSDRRFGGAIEPGLPARIVRSAVSQTADVRQAGEGRVCEVRFTLAWRHRG